MLRETTKYCAMLLLGAVFFAASATPARADAKYDPIDPKNPYGSPVFGMFHEQKVNAGGVTGTYSIFIPKGLQPWSPALMILTPAKTTAKAFAEGPVGQRWIVTASMQGIAVAFIEPAGADTWNLTLSADGRNDAEMVRQVYLNMRSKSRKIDAAFTMDKSNVGLLGYDDGGAAAQLVASELSTMFSGMASVNAPPFPTDLLKKNGEKLANPWPADNWNGKDDVKLANKDVPLPVWLIRSRADLPDNAEALAYWTNLDKAKPAGKNSYATVYQAENPVVRVWVSGPDQEIGEKAIWSQFMGKVKRFLGYAGGQLTATTDFVAAPNGTGFTVSEEMVDGFLRRWMTYVPASLKADADVPLVVVLHGSSASMYAIAEESRWHDVADKNGFIVVYGQAFINERGPSGAIPAAYWNEFSAPVDAGGSDDVVYLKHVIDSTKKKYHIDDARVYMTGHSNGANMTWRMGLEAPELFAAIAPVGHAAGAFKEGVGPGTPHILPAWTIKDEYDVDGAYALTPDSNNVKALRFWNKQNGVDERWLKVEKDSTGRYTHYNFVDGFGTPLVKYTKIEDTPHAYFPLESKMIWEDFFSMFSRDFIGGTLYNGKSVPHGPAMTSDAWLDKK